MKKYKISLTFSDKELANTIWKKLSEHNIGFKLETETIEVKEYPVAFVHFKTGPRYTYRLSDTLFDTISKNPDKGKRNWPTRYGLSYGEVIELQKLTKEQINKLYPFEKITVVQE
jgi:hypothetical protein